MHCYIICSEGHSWKTGRKSLQRWSGRSKFNHIVVDTGPPIWGFMEKAGIILMVSFLTASWVFMHVFCWNLRLNPLAEIRKGFPHSICDSCGMRESPILLRVPVFCTFPRIVYLFLLLLLTASSLSFPPTHHSARLTRIRWHYLLRSYCAVMQQKHKFVLKSLTKLVTLPNSIFSQQ